MPIFVTITFVANPFHKLFFHLWLSQPPRFQFLSEFYFRPDLLFEHHILQQKTMLAHYPFSNVISHCFSFTRSKCYKPTFPFPETSNHQVQPFTNCPVQQSDRSIIYLPNPKTPWTSPKPPISMPTWPLKSPPTNTFSLVTTLTIFPKMKNQVLLYQND